MDLNIPTVCVAMFGMFVMGFGVAKGIYMDSKPFRTRDQINIWLPTRRQSQREVNDGHHTTTIHRVRHHPHHRHHQMDLIVGFLGVGLILLFCWFVLWPFCDWLGHKL